MNWYRLYLKKNLNLNYSKIYAMDTVTNTEKPILFSTEMVQSILDGRKTQTRRVMKPQPKVHESPPCNPNYNIGWLNFVWSNEKRNTPDRVIKSSPYGRPGDELWVRETHRFHELDCGLDIIQYKVGDSMPLPNEKEAADYIVGRFDTWRPSIHMPRWASRIQLTVEDIRVERVQEITEQAAIDEGINAPFSYDMDPPTLIFAYLWDEINADRGYSWESNPWVWVIKFSIKKTDSTEAIKKFNDGLITKYKARAILESKQNKDQ